MKFLLNKDTKPELILEANDIELNGRWILHNAGYFMNKEKSAISSTPSFVYGKNEDKELSKTSLSLCEDDYAPATVLAKTVTYEDAELNNVEAIRSKRKILNEQIHILNKVQSNMLPEPLDFFSITNTFDKFDGDAVNIKDTEPVLILDYIPGKTLSSVLADEKDYAFYRHKNEPKTPENINIDTVIRFISDILAFETALLEKGYAYTALSPDHIILLKDNKPRFVGLGRICSISNDRYDSSHINYGRHLRGYSAPEFNKSDTEFGKNESVKAAIVYNLGVLMACILLNKTHFDDSELNAGSYDYNKAYEDQEKIRAMDPSGKGKYLSAIIANLACENPTGRITNFTTIQRWLQESTNFKKVQDWLNKTKVQDTTPKVGKVKFFNEDQKYGYVTYNEQDYKINFDKQDYIPPVGSEERQAGQSIRFIPSEYNGKLYAKLVKPKPPVRYPNKITISVPKTAPNTTPKLTPKLKKPKNVPTPVPAADNDTQTPVFVSKNPFVNGKTPRQVLMEFGNEILFQEREHIYQNIQDDFKTVPLMNEIKRLCTEKMVSGILVENNKLQETSVFPVGLFKGKTPYQVLTELEDETIFNEFNRLVQKIQDDNKVLPLIIEIEKLLAGRLVSEISEENSRLQEIPVFRVGIFKGKTPYQVLTENGPDVLRDQRNDELLRPEIDRILAGGNGSSGSDVVFFTTGPFNGYTPYRVLTDHGYDALKKQRNLLYPNVPLYQNNESLLAEIERVLEENAPKKDTPKKRGFFARLFG